MGVRIINADVMTGLATLDDCSVNCCVTSPPYWGLRDYGVEGQIGLEPTPELFVERLVEVFREVKRILRKDGTLWLNLGDSYNAHPGQRKTTDAVGPKQASNAGSPGAPSRSVPTLKPKDLVGIPWMTAFALRADGWYLRQEIIWSKPNPMPESVNSRCTKAHEHLFLLSSSSSYFFDANAIREDAVTDDVRRPYGPGQVDARGNGHDRGGGQLRKIKVPGGWDRGEGGLPSNCIKAGCPAGGIVLDPFGGAGTTGLVADKLGRSAVLIELNPEYAAMAEERIRSNCPMFADVNGARP